MTLAAVFSACSKDETSPLSPVYDKTFDSSNGLELFFNGYPMPDKTARVLQDESSTKLSVYSDFDLSTLSGFGMKGSIPAPGPLPGIKVLDLDIKPEATANMWHFQGNVDNDIVEFGYEGYYNESNCKIFLNDVKLKSGGISPEVWQPASLSILPNGNTSTSPIYLDWQFDPLPGLDFDFNTILNLIMEAPVIPVYGNTAYMSVSEALSEILKTIAFLPDGNIVVTYESNAFGSMETMQTQLNRFQYAMYSPSQVKLFLDPMSLFGLILVNSSSGMPSSQVNLNDKGLFPTDKSETDSELSPVASAMMKSGLSYILPRMSDGIPLSITPTNEGIRIYLDTAECMDLFANVIFPVIKDNQISELLLEWAMKNPTYAPIIPRLKQEISLLQSAFEHTNVLRIGLNLIPSQSKGSDDIYS